MLAGWLLLIVACIFVGACAFRVVRSGFAPYPPQDEEERPPARRRQRWVSLPRRSARDDPHSENGKGMLQDTGTGGRVRRAGNAPRRGVHRVRD